MTLHINLLTEHRDTPTYVLTSAETFFHTVVDPTDARAVEDELAGQELGLILLTQATHEIAEAALRLHLRTGAPILGDSHAALMGVPVARVLSHGSRVSMGGPVGLIYKVDGTLPQLVLHVPSVNLAMVGGVRVEEAISRDQLPPLPTGTQLLGGAYGVGSRFSGAVDLQFLAA